MNITTLLRRSLVALLALGLACPVSADYATEMAARDEKIRQRYANDDETCLMVCRTRKIQTADDKREFIEERAAKNIIAKLEKLDTKTLTPKQITLLFVARIRYLATLSYKGILNEGVSKEMYLQVFDKLDRMSGYRYEMNKYIKESFPERLAAYNLFDAMIGTSAIRKDDTELFNDLVKMVQDFDRTITDFERVPPSTLYAPILDCKPQDLFYSLRDIFIAGSGSKLADNFGTQKCKEAITLREAIALSTGILRFWETNAMACMVFCDYYHDALDIGVEPIRISRAARFVLDPQPSSKPQEKLATIKAHWILGNYLLRKSHKNGQDGESYEAASRHYHKAAELILSDDVWRYLGRIDQNFVEDTIQAIQNNTYWADDMLKAMKKDELPFKHDDFSSMGQEVLYQIELFDQAARAKKAKNPKLPWPAKLNAAPFLKLFELRNKYVVPKQIYPDMTVPEKLNAWLTETNERLKTAWEYQSGIKEPPKVNYMIID